MTALSNAIGEAFLPLSTDRESCTIDSLPESSLTVFFPLALLVWNYGVFAVISLVASIGFYFSFRHLDREENALNDLASGQVGEKRDEETAHA